MRDLALSHYAEDIGIPKEDLQNLYEISGVDVS